MRELEKRLMKHIDLLVERYPKLENVKQDIVDAYLVMEECYEHDGKLLIAGNGGSAADSEHIAGELMKTGFDFSRIIDESFYQKTYLQNQVMGRVLAESIMLLDGKCIVGYMKLRDMDFYGVKPSDLDGIVSQLRLTKGVEVAMFIYEHESQVFKVSLRSNGSVDVSKIASYFGGGGHVKAAGCDLAGSMYDVINNISEQIEKQLLGQDE